MLKALPFSNFKWLTNEQIEHINSIIENYTDDSETGYILECDLEYPIELHDAHSDYPLLLERMSIKRHMISDYMNDVAIGYTGKDFKNQNNEKLVLNLYDKENHVIHISMLKFVLSRGINILKNKPWYFIYSKSMVKTIYRV